MHFNDSPIGIFDSGLGGLTVYREIRKLLPFEDLIYYGDTARVPYGNKSKETIIRYSTEILRFLALKKVKIAIVACNTSSSLALESLRSDIDIPVFGVIEPGARKALISSQNGPVAVIGTSATIKSMAYSNAIRKAAAGIINGSEDNYNTGNNNNISHIRVIERACPLFVPLVEEGLSDEKIILGIIKYYLEPVLAENPSCLVLGCTHYPILENFISMVAGKNIKIIDSGVETAGAVREYLEASRMLKQGDKSGTDSFYVSDDMEKFKELGRKFLGRPLENVSLSVLG